MMSCKGKMNANGTTVFHISTLTIVHTSFTAHSWNFRASSCLNDVTGINIATSSDCKRISYF